jgi:branched-chain amino acid transport system substrate-binding protein
MKRMAAAAVLALLALSGGRAHADVVKIGFPTCLTGPGAVYGKATSNAVNMAVDELNGSGGVNGHTFEMDITDGKCSPREASLAAEKLAVNDGVNALLGAVASSASLAVKAVAERENVPMLEGVAGSDALTQPGDVYIYRVVPNMHMYTAFGADYLCNVIKPQRVAYVFQNTDFGRETVDLSKAALEKCGAKTVGWFPSAPDENNFQTAITELKASNPDVTFLIHWPPAAIAFLRQAKEAGFKSLWFNVGSLSGPDFTNKAGVFAEGFTGLNPFEATSQRPEAKRFTDDYRKRYGEDPDWFAAGYYTCVKVIADAVRRGGTSRAGIAKALKDTKDVKTVLGPISFDSTGQAPSSFTLFVYQDGRRQIKRESTLVGQNFMELK